MPEEKKQEEKTVDIDTTGPGAEVEITEEKKATDVPNFKESP